MSSNNLNPCSSSETHDLNITNRDELHSAQALASLTPVTQAVAAASQEKQQYENTTNTAASPSTAALTASSAGSTTSNVTATASSTTASVATKTNEKLSGGAKERKKNLKGRKGDPRMHKAVEARLKDPTITLLDALRAGGFDYPHCENDGSSMYTVLDSEGVQLGQRKNQLSRRLRQLRKAEGGKDSAKNASGSSEAKVTNITKADDVYDSDDSHNKKPSTAEDILIPIDTSRTNTSSDPQEKPLPAETPSNPMLASIELLNQSTTGAGGTAMRNLMNPWESQVQAAASKMSSATQQSLQLSMTQQLKAMGGSSATTTDNTHNTSTTSNPSNGMAVQQQHQMQLAAAATRTNLMLQSGLNLLQTAEANSLGSLVTNLYNGIDGRSATSGSRSKQELLATDLSSVSSNLDLSRLSKSSRGKDANSDVSSFLDACKKIHSGLSWQGRERDLSSCSTFGASTKTTNEVISASTKDISPPPGFFKDGLPSTPTITSKTNPPLSPKDITTETSSNKPPSSIEDHHHMHQLNTIENHDIKTDFDLDLANLNSDARKQMGKFNNFNNFVDKQKDFVYELYDIAGEVEDESKLVVALDFYRVESVSLMKSCMIKAGFGPEQTEECDKNYLGFVARKLDGEIRRVKRLVDIPLKKRKQAAQLKVDEVKRLKPSSSSKKLQQHNTPVDNVYQSKNDMDMSKDDVSSLGYTFEAPSSLHDEESFINLKNQNKEHELRPIEQLTAISKSLSLAKTIHGMDAGQSSKNYLQQNIHISQSISNTTTTSTTTITTKKNHHEETKKQMVRNNSEIKLKLEALPPSFDEKEQNDFIQIQQVKLTNEELDRAFSIKQSMRSIILQTNGGETKVAIKVLKKENPNEVDIERFYNEYLISRAVPHSGVRKAYDRILYKGKYALVMEWIEGKTIKELGKCNISEFLHIARETVAVLKALHDRNIVHLNLTYENILVSNEDKAIKIIDYRLATKYYVQHNFAWYCSRDDADFAFISPEQTGRLNKGVDFRADLYSVGVIFYSLLAGKLPFDSKNMSELRLMHILKQAEPLKKLDPNIPPPLSDLVAKLMEKNPDSRYLSAESLLFDLNLMLLENQLYGGLESFRIARKNCSRHLLIPKKVYGKETAVESLLSSYHKACKGSLETLVLSGGSGNGKSYILSTLDEPVSRSNGYFVVTKFYALQRNEPYAALFQALQNFFDFILSEGEDVVSSFKKVILKELGDGAKVMIELISNLHLIIGSDYALPLATGDELEIRFQYLIRKLLSALCSADHPIVLMIDDLHFADPYTIKLLTSLVTDEDLKYILIVITYQKSQAVLNMPCYNFLRSIKLLSTKDVSVDVGNLKKNDIFDLVSDIFHCEGDNALKFAEFLLAKCEGNMLFIVQMMLFLKDQKLINYCQHNYQWRWDVEKIEKETLPADLDELYKQRYSCLTIEAKTELKVAANLNSPFQRSAIEAISGNSHLEKLLIDGLLVQTSPQKSKFQFSHDQLNQLILSTISEVESNSIKQKISKVFLEKIGSKGDHEKLFIVINHFEISLKNISDPLERVDVIRIFLNASEKAMLVGAFSVASKYLSQAIELLPKNHWIEEYELSLNLHQAMIQTYLCLKDFHGLEEVAQRLIVHSNSSISKADCISVRIKALYKQQKYKEAIDLGILILDEFGESFSRPISQAIVLPSLQKIIEKLSDQLSAFRGMPKMDNKISLAAMQILCSMIDSCYFYNQPLQSLLILRMIEITLKHGVSKFTAYSLSLFGFILCRELDDVREGVRYGKLALEIITEFHEKELCSKALLIYYTKIHHWKDGVSLVLAPLQDTFYTSLELGDGNSGTTALITYYTISICIGKSLTDLSSHLNTYCRKLHAKMNIFESFRKVVLTLIGLGEEPTGLLENESFWSACSTNDEYGAFNMIFLRLQVSFIFGELRIARKCAEACKDLLQHLDCTYVYCLYFFYNGLVSAAMARKYPEKSYLINEINESISKMKNWCITSSSNFLNKLYFLEAEMTMVKGITSDAIHLYKESISVAKLNGFPNELALASEKMATIHSNMGDEENSLQCLLQSYRAYEECNIQAKCVALCTKNPGLLKFVKFDDCL